MGNRKLKFEIDDPAQNRQTEALDALQESISALKEGQSIKVWPLAGVVGMDLAAIKNTIRRYLRPRYEDMTVTQRSGEEFVRIAHKGKPRGRSAKKAEAIQEVPGDEYAKGDPVGQTPGPGTEGEGEGEADSANDLRGFNYGNKDSAAPTP